MKSALKIMSLFLLTAPWHSFGWAGEEAEVKIEKMEFVPRLLKIRVGTTVTWVNTEKRSNHSVFFQEEGLPESERLFPGESWQRVFDKPGVFHYICGPHPQMTGVLEVAP